MGLDTNGVRFLLEAQRGGVSFTQTATLARQALHLTPAQMKKVLSREAPEIGRETIASFFGVERGGSTFADAFLRYLGAKDVVSIDASDYEGATCTHNLNDDLPDALRGKFSCVIDGGTLEHVFDFPNAVLGCMKMLKLNGHLLGITPCNNLMGHGFYQFSPELIWGIYSKKNGFEVERVYIFEDRPFAVWYQVSDPRLIQARVTLCNKVPTYLLYQVRKIEEIGLTRAQIVPAQSDYELLWSHSLPEGDSVARAAWRYLRPKLPVAFADFVQDCLKGIVGRPHRGFVKPFYRKYR